MPLEWFPKAFLLYGVFLTLVDLDAKWGLAGEYFFYFSVDIGSAD